MNNPRTKYESHILSLAVQRVKKWVTLMTSLLNGFLAIPDFVHDNKHSGNLQTKIDNIRMFSKGILSFKI